LRIFEKSVFFPLKKFKTLRKIFKKMEKMKLGQADVG